MTVATPGPAAVLLRTRLEELGWSQADLARALEVTAPTVGRWLEGTRSPSLDMAFRIEKSKVGIPAAAWVTHAAADADQTGPQLAVTDADAALRTA